MRVRLTREKDEPEDEEDEPVQNPEEDLRAAVLFEFD